MSAPLPVVPTRRKFRRLRQQAPRPDDNRIRADCSFATRFLHRAIWSCDDTILLSPSTRVWLIQHDVRSSASVALSPAQRSEMHSISAMPPTIYSRRQNCLRRKRTSQSIGIFDRVPPPLARREQMSPIPKTRARELALEAGRRTRAFVARRLNAEVAVSKSPRARSLRQCATAPVFGLENSRADLPSPFTTTRC